MAVKLAEISIVSAGDVELGGVNYTAWLDPGELLTGSPTVVELTPTGLTIDNKSVNAVEVNVLDEAVAIGKAVLFRVAGQVAGKVYTIRITVSTNSTPSRTIVRDLEFITAN